MPNTPTRAWQRRRCPGEDPFEAVSNSLKIVLLWWIVGWVGGLLRLNILPVLLWDDNLRSIQDAFAHAGRIARIFFAIHAGKGKRAGRRFGSKSQAAKVHKTIALGEMRDGRRPSVDSRALVEFEFCRLSKKVRPREPVL